MEGAATNGTYQEPAHHEDDERKAFVTLNIMMSITILLVNGFVAFLFFYKPALLAKPSNRLLQSLSACDFLSGVCMICHIFIQEEIYGGDTLVTRVTVDILTTFVVEASTIHLCMITLDRALSLFYALRYRDIVTRQTVFKVIVVVWLVPFVTCVVQLTYLYPLFNDEMTDEESEKISNIEVWYSIISFIVYFLLPFILMGLAFFMMFREIRRLLLRTPTGKQRHLSGVSSQQRRVIYIFSLMYLCFSMLSMPYFSFRLFLDIKSYLGEHVTINSVVLNIFYFMKSATSIINPLLYSGLNREFRSIAGLCIQKAKYKICTSVQHRAHTTMANHCSTTVPMETRKCRGCSDSGFRDSEAFDDDVLGASGSNVSSLDETRVSLCSSKEGENV